MNCLKHLPHATWVDLVCGICLFAAALTLRLHYRGTFDGLYGQDAYAYYNFAGELGTAIREQRAPEAFFWPLGYPALLLSGLTLFGQSAASAQWFSILLGAGLALLVYVLARQNDARYTGALLAGVLMLLCGQAVQSSIVIMADIPALFWATLSAVLVGIYAKKQQTATLTAAAVTLALASITRWLYLGLAVPFALALLLSWKWQLRWRQLVFALLTAAVIFAPQLAFSHNSPYPTFNHAWVTGWAAHNALQKTFANVDGYFEYSQVNALFYAQPFYDPYYLAPVFVPLLPLGIWVSLRRKPTGGVLLTGWVLLPYIFLIGIPYQNNRFVLIVTPPIFVMVGLGFDRLMRVIHSVSLPRGYSRRALASAAFAGVSVLALLGGIQMYRAADHTVQTFVSMQQREKQIAAWIMTRIPSGAVVYTFGLTLTLEHYGNFEVREIFYETPASLEAGWQHGQHDYLVINAWQVVHQWNGLAPQIAYHWLRDQRGLVPIGRIDNYTVFRING